MKIIILGFILISTACSNTIPQIKSLGLGGKGDGGSTSPVQTPTFTSPNSPGASEAITGDGYKVKILIHSGSEGQYKTSNDGYKLEIRSLSL